MLGLTIIWTMYYSLEQNLSYGKIMNVTFLYLRMNSKDSYNILSFKAAPALVSYCF